MDFSLEGIREAARTGIALVFYPLLTAGVLVFIAATISTQIGHATDRIRRFTAALLPVIVLLFALMATDVNSTAVVQGLGLGTAGQFIVGILLGAAAIFAGRWLGIAPREIGSTIYVLLLSALGCLMLYDIAAGGFTSLRGYLFGMVVGASVYIIAAGWFWPRPAKKQVLHDASLAARGNPESTRADREEPPRIYPPSI